MVDWYKIKRRYLWENLIWGSPTPISPIDLLTDVIYYYKMQGNGDNYTWTAAEALSTTTWTVTYWDNYATLTSAVLRNNALTYTGSKQTIWIRINMTSGNDQTISAGFDGNGVQWWGMWVYTTSCAIVVSGSAYSVNMSTLVWAGWHFVVITFDWSGAVAYRDWVSIWTITRAWSVRSTKWISIWRFGYSSTFYNWDLWICFLTESTISAQTVSDFYNATKWIYGIS